MRPKRVALVALALAAVTAPAVAQGEIEQQSQADESMQPQLFGADEQQAFGLAPFELAYLKLRERADGELASGELGPDIVVDGVRAPDGDVREPTRNEVLEEAKRLRDALAEARAIEEISAGGGGYASAATVQCESGGDYSIDTGNGYYGGYQFDQSTWDNYAPEEYVGVRPSEVPPEVQDAVAASVTYDAWPNC